MGNEIHIDLDLAMNPEVFDISDDELDDKEYVFPRLSSALKDEPRESGHSRSTPRGNGEQDVVNLCSDTESSDTEDDRCRVVWPGRNVRNRTDGPLDELLAPRASVQLGDNEMYVWETLLYLEKGTAKSISNIVIINENQGIALSISGGYSKQVNMWAETENINRAPEDEELSPKLLRSTKGKLIFARLIQFNEKLGLTSGDNFDITVDANNKITELASISQRIVWEGELPTFKNGEAVELLLENCNGVFVVPMKRGLKRSHKCNLVRRKESKFQTSNLILKDQLKVEVYRHLIVPTDLRYKSGMRRHVQQPPRKRIMANQGGGVGAGGCGGGDEGGGGGGGGRPALGNGGGGSDAETSELFFSDEEDGGFGTTQNRRDNRNDGSDDGSEIAGRHSPRPNRRISRAESSPSADTTSQISAKSFPVDTGNPSGKRQAVSANEGELERMLAAQLRHQSHTPTKRLRLTPSLHRWATGHFNTSTAQRSRRNSIRSPTIKSEKGSSPAPWTITMGYRRGGSRPSTS